KIIDDVNDPEIPQEVFNKIDENLKKQTDNKDKNSNMEQLKKMPSLSPQTISINNNTTTTFEKRNSIPKKRSDADLELETNAEIDKQNIEKEIENILN
ncbi:MAG: hypothetical protein GX944_02840, partial [Alphaproteobacteria bacterium]|nr:hypothetical protein [Alphaproteobacteria bacterium]